MPAEIDQGLAGTLLKRGTRKSERGSRNPIPCFRWLNAQQKLTRVSRGHFFKRGTRNVERGTIKPCLCSRWLNAQLTRVSRGRSPSRLDVVAAVRRDKSRRGKAVTSHRTPYRRRRLFKRGTRNVKSYPVFSVKPAARGLYIHKRRKEVHQLASDVPIDTSQVQRVCSEITNVRCEVHLFRSELLKGLRSLRRVASQVLNACAELPKVRLKRMRKRECRTTSDTWPHWHRMILPALWPPLLVREASMEWAIIF